MSTDKNCPEFGRQKNIEKYMDKHNVSFYEANKIFQIDCLNNLDDVSGHLRMSTNNFSRLSQNDDSDPECLTSRIQFSPSFASQSSSEF